jgi:UDP-N-acetylglucosamine 4,6-dehydratase
VFRRQAQEGVLTITDPRMTRFWLTLDQAVDLVVYALRHMRGGEVFIPRIPSMRVTDLAEAIAPDVPTEIIGIRPGEKLHELLLTADESRHTVQVGDVFVVLPENPSWDKGTDWAGDPVEEGWVYSSGTNDWWLSGDELSELLP